MLDETSAVERAGRTGISLAGKRRLITIGLTNPFHLTSLGAEPSANETGGTTITTLDWESTMDRRTVLKGLAGVGSLAATGGLSMPALSQGAAARTLRFVPQANLANFDPIWGTQYVVRNAAALVWDTLYGVDAKLQPQRQMVESEEVSDDGLVWTFRLRPGLKFHDGEPVLSKDVVAS